MVDEARDVAAYARIDHRPVCQLEAPDVPALNITALAFQALLIGDQLASVVNDPCILGDARCREDAPSMDTRTPFLNHS
jgi:hypothetical protein